MSKNLLHSLPHLVALVRAAPYSPITMIYHLAKHDAWTVAQSTGVYTGNPADRADGFLHLSTASQIEESARRHRAGEADLVLLHVDEAQLDARLVWGESRGGKLFPHVYGDIPLSAVKQATPLSLNADGIHQFPELGSENGAD